MTNKIIAMLTVAAALSLSSSAYAQSGPVANSCKAEIEKFCDDKSHNGDVRACLEEKKAEVSAPCRQALDTTGGGRGAGQGQGRGKDRNN